MSAASCRLAADGAHRYGHEDVCPCGVSMTEELMALRAERNEMRSSLDEIFRHYDTFRAQPLLARLLGIAMYEFMDAIRRYRGTT